MEDPDYKALASQVNHDILNEDAKFDRKNLKRSEQTRLVLSCPCQICQQTRPAKAKLSKRISQVSRKPAASKGFTWLLEKLGMISQSYQFKLNIPDTAVFKKGKASFYLQYQRDRTMKLITSIDKLTNQEIIKSIINIVRNRKKEEFSLKSSKGKSPLQMLEYGKETACLRYMAKGRDNDLEEFSTEDELGAMKIMNESEFTGLMWQRSGSNLWKSICYIQALLKCRKGANETFVHSFRFDATPPNEIVQAGLDDNEELEDLMYSTSPSQYSEFIFKRIRFLLEKYLGIILHQIKGEFMSDDNQKPWLISASDILVSETGVKFQEEKEEKTLKYLTEKKTENSLLTHLEYVSKLPKNQRTEKFSLFMSQECEKIFNESQIMQIFKDTEPDLASNKAFATLKRLTPYTLDELLDKEKADKLLKEYLDTQKHKKSSSEVPGIDYEPTPRRRALIIRNSFIRTPRSNLTHRSKLSSNRRLSMASTFVL